MALIVRVICYCTEVLQGYGSPKHGYYLNKIQATEVNFLRHVHKMVELETM